MPRVLVMSERAVTEGERAAYLQTLAVRRERATAASANFWVFEQRGRRGRFLEFVEAGQPESLNAAVLALASVDSAFLTDLPRWFEVPESS